MWNGEMGKGEEEKKEEMEEEVYLRKQLRNYNPVETEL